MLPLEFVDGLKTKTLSRQVRHEIKDRASVAGDDNRLALLDLAGKLEQAIFCIAN